MFTFGEVSRLPAYRFGTAFKIGRGVKVFVSLEGGVTRGTVPDASQKAQPQRLENTDLRIAKLRRKLKDKNQEITRLKRKLSAARGPANSIRTTPKGSLGDIEEGTLPDFIIIGGQKCGTTFLYHLLCQHPHVEAGARKEVHYFDMRFERGIGWYRAQFPRPREVDGRRVITGEASPYYLYHPHAARRAAEVVPQAKLIALLRDPVDRAFSDYHDKVRLGKEPLAFEEAIEAEESRLRGEREKMLADERYASGKYRAFSYISRGIYVDQLQTWLEFFDREQLLVLKSEDMFENPSATLQRVLNFLNLPDWKPDSPPVSETLNAGRYAMMNPATQQRLRDYFEPHNQRLYAYLNTDFDW
jgi:hypothetical protein